MVSGRWPREGRKLAVKVGEKRTAVRDRSRSIGRKLRTLTRTIRRLIGEAKREVLQLTEQTGQLLERSIKEARQARRHRSAARAQGGAKAKMKAAKALEELADRCEKVARQITQRVAGEPITDRLVSLWDPDARPAVRWVSVVLAGGTRPGFSSGVRFAVSGPGFRFWVSGSRVSSEGGVRLGVVAECRPAGPYVVAGVAFEA